VDDAEMGAADFDAELLDGVVGALDVDAEVELGDADVGPLAVVAFVGGDGDAADAEDEDVVVAEAVDVDVVFVEEPAVEVHGDFGEVGEFEDGGRGLGGGGGG
jgi:hypothetical protein